MHFGVIVTTGDPRTVAQLAAEAEAAGWDGAFYWDAIAVGEGDIYDPWVVMAAMAMRTERVRLGAIVTPPARRRPWKLAREMMTLDRLSNGRLVLAVGLGALDDAAFGNVGEPTDARTRAELLDESLAILTGLWTGEPFAFDGRHHRFGPMTFRPTPVQRPRIPVWVAGAWPSERSIARTLRWDGIVVQAQADGGGGTNAALEAVRSLAARAERERATGMLADGRHWEIVTSGSTPAGDPAAASAVIGPREAAGATWWLEADWDNPTVERLRARIAAGPPRVADR